MVPAGNEILNNKVAQLIPKGNVPLMAEKIIEMILSEEKRQTIEKNAYNYYLNNYTTEIMVHNTANHYNSILKQ